MRKLETYIKEMFVVGVVGSVLATFCSNACAGTFFTPTGSLGANGPVSGEAIFSVSGDVVTITLENLLPNPKSAGQLLSGITFDITGATGNATGFSGSGNTTMISSGGSFSTPALSTSLGWQESRTGTSFNLNAFSGGKPNDMIIGPAVGGLYGNANPSITGHNPVVVDSATFIITIPGVSPTSVISGVVFNFGTSPGELSIGVPDKSASIALFGMGLGCLGLCRYRFGRRISGDRNEGSMPRRL